MKRIHPNIARVAHLAMLIYLSSHIGCKTPSGGVANPFLAPNRVPPPATRALMPGHAQPYYPGDPLPVMQSSTAPEQPPAPGSGLAWGSRNASVVAASDDQSARAPGANENVAIPTDESDLRFEALPSEAAAQIASLGAPPSPSPPSTPAPAATSQPVVQASFNEPPKAALATTTPDVNLVDVEVTSPWRSPQISQAIASLPSPPVPPRVALPGGETSGMGVRMRPVPSPPAEQPGQPTPRIRLPGYNVPQNFSNAHLPPGTVIYYAAPMMPAYESAPHAAQPNPLNVASMPLGPSSDDGFRPRTAMR